MQDLEFANLIDEVCDEFEANWRAGARPTIEAYLQKVPPACQASLQRELLSLEAVLRRARASAAAGQVDPATAITAAPRGGSAASTVLLPSGREPVQEIADLLDGQLSSEFLPASLADLHRFAEQRSFAAGEYLIRQGEATNSLFIISKGKVNIIVDQPDGQRRIIDCSGPGEVLGEMALLTSAPRTASAIATEPVTAAVMEADTFHRLTRDHPYLSMLLSQLIAQRLGTKQFDALSGKHLDRYQIVQRLGRGGMSVVYQAIDSHDQQTVALKMLSHRLINSPRAKQRFQQEADIIERFEHPHIVRMLRRFAAFRTFFIVMEYCTGQTLGELLHRQGPLSPTHFRRYFGQLARALHYAHQEGICHRDIKPGNVMCVSEGQLKLMDFGLAEPRSRFVDSGEVVGTPRYMAPEQRTGGPVADSADWFSLGCVAYEMLSGIPLFRQDEIAEIHRDFSGWQPPDFTQLSPQLEPAIAAQLQTMLHVDPAARRVDWETLSRWMAQ